MRILELLGIDPERIVQHEPGHITRIERVILPGLRNPNAYLDPESRSLFVGLAKQLRDGRPRRPIYVSRLGHAKAGGSTRIMQNEEGVISCLADLGVEIVEPEKLSMEEQIRTFDAASLVIGPSGSGMFNVAFCREGTPVIDIESEDHWIYAHAGLFASCGLPYGLLEGRPDPTDDSHVHRRWAVNVDALVQRVAGYLN